MTAQVQMPKYAELYRPSRLDTDLSSEEFDSFPKIRWSPKHHRLEYFSPTHVQPGDHGFLLLQHLAGPESFGAMMLSEHDRKELIGMEKMNKILAELELREKLDSEIERKSHTKKKALKQHHIQAAKNHHGSFAHLNRKSCAPKYHINQP